MLSPIGIESDVADLSAGGAALECFPSQGPHHLVREILGVELCDGSHDAMKQLPIGRRVDRLGSGDEARIRRVSSVGDRGVVAPITDEPIDLLHDDEIDWGRDDVVEHARELGPLEGLTGATAIDKLRNNECTEFVGTAPVRLALGRDGEAFLGRAAACLMSR